MKREIILGSIFLSHSSLDKPFVKRLAADIRQDGFFVWVDEAEIKVGDSLIGKIEEGIENCDYLGVVVSGNSVKSEWVTREVRVALNQEIHGKRVKVLPILLERVDMPVFLLDKKYVDFTIEEKYKDSLQLILERLSELPEGTDKKLLSNSELQFYKQQLEQAKNELNVTRGEKRLILERLEKERKNISSHLRAAIEHEKVSFPYLDDINRLYAFETSFSTITAGYLLHGLRKEYMKGGPHQIALICELDKKTDELALLMEATLTRINALREDKTEEE